MYIPREFELKDREQLLAFVRQYSFGLLVSAEGDVPVATHLPFHLLEQEGHLKLTAHLARANEQCRLLDGRPVLVVFSEPHAYISPSLYNHERNVPTWNYVAVHMTGTCHTVTDEATAVTILEQMVVQNEPGYMEQWHRLDPAYKAALLREIVAIEIKVTDVKATEKLSQNKTAEERSRIATALSASADGAARDLAGHMMATLHKDQGNENH